MRLAEVQLPELVCPILEQLQDILASIRAARAANMNLPPGFPARQLPPPPMFPPRLKVPPLHLSGQIVAISRLQEEMALVEEDSRLRVLALTDGNVCETLR